MSTLSWTDNSSRVAVAFVQFPFLLRQRGKNRASNVFFWLTYMRKRPTRSKSPFTQFLPMQIFSKCTWKPNWKSDSNERIFLGKKSQSYNCVIKDTCKRTLTSVLNGLKNDGVKIEGGQFSNKDELHCFNPLLEKSYSEINIEYRKRVL